MSAQFTDELYKVVDVDTSQTWYTYVWKITANYLFKIEIIDMSAWTIITTRVFVWKDDDWTHDNYQASWDNRYSLTYTLWV